MRRICASIGIGLGLLLVVPEPAAASYRAGTAPDRVTSRQIRSTAKFIRAVELIERDRGITRGRSASDPWWKLRTLRQPDVRVVRKARTKSGVINRRQSYRTPVLQKTRPSRYSLTPVSAETQAAYRSGIWYALGSNGLRKDLPYAYMWLNIALTDGHPLARSALAKVSRQMTRTQLARAHELTKELNDLFLRYDDDRPEYIRDAVRQHDVDELLTALLKFWEAESNQGSFPAVIPYGKPKEICRLDAITCQGYVNLESLVPTHVLHIPVDPLADFTGNGTGYEIMQDDYGYIIISAPYSELKYIYAEG